MTLSRELWWHITTLTCYDHWEVKSQSFLRLMKSFVRSLLPLTFYHELLHYVHHLLFRRVRIECILFEGHTFNISQTCTRWKEYIVIARTCCNPFLVLEQGTCCNFPPLTNFVQWSAQEVGGYTDLKSHFSYTHYILWHTPQTHIHSKLCTKCGPVWTCNTAIAFEVWLFHLIERVIAWNIWQPSWLSLHNLLCAVDANWSA